MRAQGEDNEKPHPKRKKEKEKEKNNTRYLSAGVIRPEFFDLDFCIAVGFHIHTDSFLAVGFQDFLIPTEINFE